MSAHLKRKNLPPKWRYAISPRKIKRVAEQLAADIRVIEFCGTSKPYDLRDETVLWLGAVNARIHEDCWCFRLSFYGVPERFLANTREMVERAIIDDVTSFVERIAKGPANSTVELFDRSLAFRVRGDTICADFKTSQRDSFGESVDQSAPWWL